MKMRIQEGEHNFLPDYRLNQQDKIRIFEDKKVRILCDSEQDKWYFPIVDTIEVLTESPNLHKYWSVLKPRLKKEGSQLATNCSQLKMQSADGKFYKTDIAETEQLFRLIQTIHRQRQNHLSFGWQRLPAKD